MVCFSRKSGAWLEPVNATVYAWLDDEDSINWDVKAPTFDVARIVDRTGRKVDSNGDVLEEGLTSQIGTVQLKGYFHQR